MIGVRTELAQAHAGVEIVDHGRMTNEEWPGKVSADEALADLSLDRGEIRRAVDRLDEFYVPVGELAVTRCIDGRHDPDLDESNLGPQVPGGVAGATLAYKIGVDESDARAGSFLTDAESMIKTFLRHELPLGGHRDEHSIDSDSSIGCGAIDAMNTAVEAMANPDLHHDHKQLVLEIMGDDFDRDIYMRNMGIAGFVHASSANYFRGREAVMDTLEKHSGGPVPVLKGNHREGLFVVNKVPDTTFASNRFAEEFGGLQAFGYDLWRSQQMAEIILPGKAHEDERRKFVTARVMTTVATLMALTDGTQQFIIRDFRETEDTETL